MKHYTHFLILPPKKGVVCIFFLLLFLLNVVLSIFGNINRISLTISEKFGENYLHKISIRNSNKK